MRDRLLAAERVKAIEWRDGVLYLLDQRALPQTQRWLRAQRAEQVVEAIATQAVQGVAVVSIAAAFAAVLSVRQHPHDPAAVAADLTLLAASQPGNPALAWALGCMQERQARHADPETCSQALEQEALALLESDREANLVMAQYGMGLIRKRQGNAQVLLTHGNAGALSGGGFGTALGVIRAAWAEGLVQHVYASESRPTLAGSRLTTWELAAEGIDVTLTTDALAASVMRNKGVSWVVVGADSVAANGDVAAPAGTYSLAVNAMHHDVRFMVVAPSIAFDLRVENGEAFTLAEQAPLGGDAPAFNPTQDMTPADLIDVFVTEKGVVERPNAAKLEQLLCRKRLH